MNERYSIKRLYLITFAVYFVSCILMYNSKEIYFILPLCSSLGILITAITTLPYQLISKFHEDNSYISRNKNSKIDLKKFISVKNIIFKMFKSFLKVWILTVPCWVLVIFWLRRSYLSAWVLLLLILAMKWSWLLVHFLVSLVMFIQNILLSFRN